MKFSNTFSCFDLIANLSSLKIQTSHFDDLHQSPFQNLKPLITIQKEISLNTKEILSRLWPFELITPEKIEQQRNNQAQAYEAVGLLQKLPSGQLGFIEQGIEYPFPTINEIKDYIQSDPELTELLKQKEKEGFTQLLITPFLQDIHQTAQTIEQAVIKQGGQKNNYWSDKWKDQVSFRYFIHLNPDGTLSDGLTKAQIKDKSNFLLNGYLISFREANPNIPHRDDPDEFTGKTKTRKKLKAGKTAQEYLDILQNPNNPDYRMYQGEEAMLPEEWFALFAEDLYTKYIRQNKQIEQDNSSQLLDFDRWCWFVTTKFQGSGRLPGARWSPGDRRVDLGDDALGFSGEHLGVRPSVRKKFKL